VAEDSSLLRKVVRRLVRGVLLLSVIPIGAFAGLHYYIETGRFVETENAYVKADIIAISADVSGRVIWVGASNNEPVEAGQPLLKIDPETFEIAVREADAELQVVRTEIAALQAEHREARAELSEAQERVRFMEQQYARQEQLRKKGIARIERYDEAHHELESARQRLRVIGERIGRVKAELGGRPDGQPERHPRFMTVKARRDRAELALEDTTVYAPADGVTTNVKLQAGEYVTAGTPIFSLIDGGPVWIEANLKETQLTYLDVGQSVEVVIDAYPDVKWQASVDRIAPATGAEFALLPPQNATGNWVKVVQRLPVRLNIERPDGAPQLRASMTATIRIDTERVRSINTLIGEAIALTRNDR
jgi:membrane fusion protein (multidrug efflux system)